MARPVFRKVKAEEDRRLVHLDRDRALVEAALRDPAAFDALYRKYLAQVYSYAYYELGNHHDAEDAAERTFLLALGALRPLRGAGPAGRRRRRVDVPGLALPDRPQRGRQHPARPAAPPGRPARGGGSGRRPDDIEAEVSQRHEAGAAWAAVARLPAERRRALVLRFVEEMSTAEIAGILGRSEGAVRVLIHRGLRAVARDLGGRRW